VIGGEITPVSILPASRGGGRCTDGFCHLGIKIAADDVCHGDISQVSCPEPFFGYGGVLWRRVAVSA